jgi:hypothetical protein
MFTWTVIFVSCDRHYADRIGSNWARCRATLESVASCIYPLNIWWTSGLQMSTPFLCFWTLNELVTINLQVISRMEWPSLQQERRCFLLLCYKNPDTKFESLYFQQCVTSFTNLNFSCGAKNPFWKWEVIAAVHTSHKRKNRFSWGNKIKSVLILPGFESRKVFRKNMCLIDLICNGCVITWDI